MFDIERWQEIFDAIRKNKLRTFLTGVSVGSGIFILVVLLGVGQGMQNGISKEFENDASNSVWVWVRPTTVKHRGMNPGRTFFMSNEDASAIQQKNQEYIDKQSPVVRLGTGFITYGKESGSYRLNGVHPGYQFIENEGLVAGRFINQSDLAENKKVVVIGNRVKKDLFRNVANVVGSYVKINDISFKVVGVFSEKAGDREEQKVFIPLETSQKVFNRIQKLDLLTYTLKPEKNFDKAVEKSNEFIASVQTHLRSKHLIAPSDELAIGVQNSLQSAKRFYELLDMIKAFFWWVGVCTIIAGVVGVSNIMLIIVKERTKEIGVRKALGAQPMSIIGMILHEAIFVTAAAGFLGLILGLVLLEYVGPMVETEYITNPSVNFSVALTTVFILIGSGAIAGVFPAWRAAKIKPIVALRDE